MFRGKLRVISLVQIWERESKEKKRHVLRGGKKVENMEEMTHRVNSARQSSHVSWVGVISALQSRVAYIDLLSLCAIYIKKKTLFSWDSKTKKEIKID